MSSGQSLDFLKVIGLIGCDSEDAVLAKGAMNGVEKIIGNNPATMMASFRPWIREEQIKCFNRCFRNQIANGVTALDFENADIGEMR